jgi:hypothetical protein
MWSYFKRMNLPGPVPLPIVGNMLGRIYNSFIYNDMLLIKKYGKTCGCFEMSEPVILTTDVKFIKAVLIKDFNSFQNRRVSLVQTNEIY